MKVLVLLDSLSLGGAENVAATLVDLAPDAGLAVDVVSLGPPTGEAALWREVLESRGGEVRFLAIPRLLHPRSVPAVARAIRASGCDVVHAHLSSAITLGVPAARLVGRPTMCTFHSLPTEEAGRRVRREALSVAVANRSAGVVCVSQASLDGFSSRYRVRSSRWGVLRNGVDLTRFVPEAQRLPADLDVPDGVPVVSLVAHMRPLKGHADAIDAWGIVLRQVPDARLVLVGDGPLMPELRKRASSLGDRVVFAGLRVDVEQVVGASSAVLLPTYREALPTALIEAAATGVPTVSTTVGGVPEVVEDGVTGTLVAPGDVRALADAVAQLLSDEPRRLAMGRAARARAEALFDARTWVRELCALYEDAAAGRPLALAAPGDATGRARRLPALGETR